MQLVTRYTSLLNNRFVAESWGKHPTTIALPPDFRFVSEDLLLGSLHRYTTNLAQLRRANVLAEFVTAIDNIKTPTPNERFAALPSDITLDAYISRVEAANKSRDWSIAYFGLHGASGALWDEAKIFLESLHSALGYRPAGRVDVDCFIGRYASTPSGIHVDGGHNFSFTYRDGKTMYTWPGSRTELLWLKSPDYDGYKPESFPLPNTRESLCYFPFDNLHVGETKGQVSVNVNVSVWEKATNLRQNIEFLISKLQVRENPRLPQSHSGPTTICEQDAEHLATVRSVLENESLERQMVLASLLSQTTANMMVPRPLEATVSSSSREVFRLRDMATLQWYSMRSGSQIVIAGNGHCVVCTHDPDVLAFLRDCSCSGATVDRRELSAFPDLVDLLDLLITWGVFEPTKQSEGDRGS